jgi:hypothetical protein
MVNARASILIDRPPESVFDFVALGFYENYPRWSPEVQRLDTLSPGPIQVGSLARQVRVDHGRRSESTFRVTALEQPSRLEFVETRERYRIGYRLDAADGATRLTLAFELTRLELHLRPLVRIIRRVAQEGAERAVQRIKGLVEGETVGATKSRAAT